MEGLPEGVSFYAGDPTIIYKCVPCKSQQDYQQGKLHRIIFRVGQYWLHFLPKYNHFDLGRDPPNDPCNTETILVFKFLPPLTPQNTTEERIKLLLLFS